MTRLQRILHVEDDHDILEISQLALETVGGFELKQFTLGTEAAAQIGDFKPDLFLLDVMMPVIDGIETLKLLHQIDELENVPAIFMSAKNLSEHKALLDLGDHVIGTIEKPFDTMNLATQIGDLWAAHQPARMALAS